MTGDSSDNIPPTTPPLPPPPSSPPLPPPLRLPQPPEPRSSWWVVGFLTPVLVAIISVIGVLIANSQGSASPDGSKPPSGATESADPALPGSSKPSTGATTSSPTVSSSSDGTRETPPKVRFGPQIFDFPGDENIDLDSNPPILIDTLTRGTDVGFYGDRTSLGTLNGDPRLAPLPPSGPDPSEAECVAAVQANGTYNLPLTRGARYCAISRDGRTAYLRAVAAPAVGTIRLEVTVWEIPD